MANAGVSPLFSIAGKLGVAAELFIPQGGGDDESIASFVRRRFGQEAVDYLADPLLAGIHAGDAERLSIRALFPRLLEAERQSGSVLKAFRALHIKPSPQGAFVSLPGGVAELAEAVAAALPPDTIQLNARVVELHRNGMWRVQTAAGRIESRAVILATPAYLTGGLLRAIDTSLSELK